MRGDAAEGRENQDVAPPGYPSGFGEGPAERDALMILSTLRGISPRQLHGLAWEVGCARACVGKIGSGRAGSAADRDWIGAADPAVLRKQLKGCGGRLVAPHDPGYPGSFAGLLHDPPAWLFVRGAELHDGPDRVAVVGARRCSSLGREISHDLGRRLGGIGIHVVSGGAFGIDAAAHRGALAADGVSIGVLGSGLDVLYPRSSADLLLQIAERGTLISEYPPGQRAEPHHFPARNRLVVALSRALVVVEGAARSGSRISVDHALDLGRDVFAVPGPVTSPLSETPHEIIREGATLIRGADDLLADLGYESARADDAVPPAGLSDIELRVWLVLGETSLPDAVARTVGIAIPEAVTVLIRLELRGLVRGVGGRYERTLAAASGSATA
ncbi:MAG: processing protein [Actinomycetota bacterium]|nr:processing protein [Actinomycetota bacterium]